MANPSSSMDFLGMLRNKLEEAPPDALREIVSSTIQLLMSAEADALCGADTASAATSGSTPARGSGVHAPGGDLGPAAGHQGHLQVAGLGDGQEPGRGGQGVLRRGRRRLDDLPAWPGGAGLSGVKLVTSDSHEGLKPAIAAVLPGAVCTSFAT